MSQSLATVLLHVVFSTKNRTPWIAEPLRAGLFGYLAAVGRDLGCEVFRVGGVADHVHLAVDLGRTITVADFVKKVKQVSSVWMKMPERQCPDFEWQGGYGAFSVGRSQLAALIGYVEGQEEHHRVRTFQEEYRALLARYEVKGDERHLWD